MKWGWQKWLEIMVGILNHQCNINDEEERNLNYLKIWIEESTMMSSRTAQLLAYWGTLTAPRRKPLVLWSIPISPKTNPVWFQLRDMKQKRESLKFLKYWSIPCAGWNTCSLQDEVVPDGEHPFDSVSLPLWEPRSRIEVLAVGSANACFSPNNPLCKWKIFIIKLYKKKHFKIIFLSNRRPNLVQVVLLFSSNIKSFNYYMSWTF